jgi:hypothetical protein
VTPQEREGIQKFYYSLNAGVEGGGHQEIDEQQDMDRIIDLLAQTRRAALRDVLSDLDSLHWKEHWYADQLRKKINDRLASEGG